MKRENLAFRGEAPRVTPRALPDVAAQVALNARLLTGDLTAWRQFIQTKGLANTGPVRTIYLLKDRWLSWDVDVDVARGIIPGDTTYRTYLTAPDLYGQPRFTNYALATTGAEPFPVTTRPLGVPNPDSPPTLQVGVDSTATTFSIDVLDEGDKLVTSWSTSPDRSGGGTFGQVTQDAVLGNPAPSYQLAYDENHDPGTEVFAYRDFGVAGATVVRGSVDIYFSDSVDVMQAGFAIASTLAGAGVRVVYSNGELFVEKASEWGAVFASAVLVSTPVVPALSANTWYTMSVQAVTNSDGGKTVTAQLFQGSGQLASITVTNNFDDGNFCGVSNGNPADAATRHRTNYDNIHIQASGSTGFVPTNLATSYVYTFVNDLGEQSGPSEASVTILRPDGVSVTVTTPTVVPTGISSEYDITSKRIYRAATGNVGTQFLFVAEIPLTTEDYVDVLTDAQLGEVLESTGWDLPPDDLEGILALPNGVMVGFRRNQLCLSAQNRPHAWPPLFRLNTDTDIVGIGNVDNTVVIGTGSFVYVATGNDPAAYSMSKSDVPYACMSKYSFAYLTTIGVVFAGTNGLMAVAGIGQVTNITESVFTDLQWKALDPATIRAVAHNDIYWMFSSVGAIDFGTRFEDTFTGAAGSIAGHTPETAPAGFAWSSNTSLALDGAGNLTNPANNSSFSFADAVVAIGSEYTVTLEATMDDGETVDNTFVSFIVGDSTGAGDPQLILNINRTAPATFEVEVIVTGDAPADTTVSVNASGAHTYALEVDPLGVSILMDGVPIGTLAADMTAISQIDNFEIAINSSNGLDHTIQRVAIEGAVVGVPRAYALDMKKTGFGVIELGFHACAQFVNPIGDTMYLVLDVDEEPDDPLLPIPPTTPNYVTSGTTIFEFEGSETDLMTYRWKSKLWLLEHPATMVMAQVKAEDYDNLLFRVYGDGAQVDEIVITSQEEFTLVLADEYSTLQYEVLGTSTVRTIQVAEDVSELS